ncbi:hypothetical protein QFC20_004981 [Naganishia adeliensis]|uniref:Uncharacterized protein n=1 Tax=Naganishia adeliensis TaxID=92952 RepID=A0ACC2VT45_9TREE|nr:hypothetical protein QFC20_004981 [Naganishia adeliensis]
MSYIRGGTGGQDDATHKAHCTRVNEGVRWDPRPASTMTTVGGRSVTMTGGKLASWRSRRRGGGSCVVLSGVEFGKGKGKEKEERVGNVLCVEGYEAAADKRVMEILESVDTVLSAPPLPSEILGRCKIFLFTTSSHPPATGNKRLKPPSSSSAGTGNGKTVERVVGCVVVQPIRTGMRVLQGDEGGMDEGKRKRDEVVVVGEDAESAGDAYTSSKAVICSPTRLPSKIGIHRIFTVPKYRGLGISKILLDVACEKTIYGYTCDPAKGDVAFSQPTSSGKALMDAWGRGGVMVFVEDEQQSDAEE